MKLALLGHPLDHSLSPRLYRELLGSKLETYELLDCAQPEEAPSLEELALRFEGLNITSPYKRHFFGQVEIESEAIKQLGALNTLVFCKNKIKGTNTDFLAVIKILQDFKQQYESLKLVLLGNGAMAELTQLVAKNLGLSCSQFHRGQGIDLQKIDLSKEYEKGKQTIVVNSCSRSFEFKGHLHSDFLFWDYNYLFPPHSNLIPFQVKSYIDGQEMLQVQAKAAIKFWEENIS